MQKNIDTTIDIIIKGVATVVVIVPTVWIGAYRHTMNQLQSTVAAEFQQSLLEQCEGPGFCAHRITEDGVRAVAYIANVHPYDSLSIGDNGTSTITSPFNDIGSYSYKVVRGSFMLPKLIEKTDLKNSERNPGDFWTDYELTNFRFQFSWSSPPKIAFDIENNRSVPHKYLGLLKKGNR